VEIRRLTLKSLLLQARDRLAGAGVPSPDADAEALIGHVLGIRRTEVFLRRRSEVSPRDEAAITGLVERRAARIPLQILLGDCEFMSLPFKVREGVFIPRPETEVLVDSVLERVRAGGTGVRRVLDIGTGTGVAAVSLAVHLGPDLVVATDISPVAVEIARGNAILNRVMGCIRLAVCDGLKALRRDPATGFDLVVCNPPYVETGAIAGLEPEVRDHDPRIALDGGVNGLEFIAGILPGVASILSGGGRVAFEIGATQGERVKRLFEDVGLKGVEIISDLVGLDRVVTGSKV
jgi:release factor glutamine methyltransferase